MRLDEVNMAWESFKKKDETHTLQISNQKLKKNQLSFTKH
jgi:hypothetical protein